MHPCVRFGISGLRAYDTNMAQVMTRAASRHDNKSFPVSTVLTQRGDKDMDQERLFEAMERGLQNDIYKRLQATAQATGSLAGESILTKTSSYGCSKLKSAFVFFYKILAGRLTFNTSDI